MDANKYENILQDIQPNPHSINHAKMTYLTHEKERLQIQIAQLLQQNQLLRTINKQLTKHTQHNHQSAMIAHLNQQNQLLEQSYLRLLHENQRLASLVLMGEQINDQSIIEHQTISKDYEEKIIELRRSIQLKETSIQQLQKKLKTEGSVVIPPTNVTLLFFNQIDELKKTIETLSVRNKQLQKQNKQFKNISDKLQNRLSLLQLLTTKSKLIYEEFKHYYEQNNRARRHSAPKKNTYLPLNYQSTNKKLNEGQSCVQTRENTACSTRVDPPIKMVIYKQSVEISDLKQKYKNIQNRLKMQQQYRQKVAAANCQLTNKLSTLLSQTTYYKKSTQNFMQLLSHKGIRHNSSEKLPRQNFISSIKKPAQVSYITQRKQFWLNLQQSIKVDRFKLLHIKNKYRTVKRSLSCFVDYHRSQVDNVEKYLNKKATGIAHKKYKMEEQTEQGTNDFSMFIDEVVGDISIINSSQKAKAKTNYSEWKRNTKSKNILNLTILQQNIL